MAAKIIFAVLAGLVVAEVALANPVKVNKRLVRSSTTNVFLEKVAAALETLEGKFDNITEAVEEGIEDAVEAVENATLTFARKVESALEALAENSTSNSSSTNCTSTSSLNTTALLEELRNASLECIEERIEDVETAANEVLALFKEYKELVNETEEAEAACAEEGSVLLEFICGFEKGAELLIEVSALNAKVLVAGGLVVAEVAELTPMAAYCTGAKVVTIVEEIIDSIESLESCSSDDD